MAGWMTGRSGTRVHIRFQPHHLDQIEIFDADNRRHLGTAYLADQATDEQIEQVYQARAERARRVRRDLRRAETLRRRRFKAHQCRTGPGRHHDDPQRGRQRTAHLALQPRRRRSAHRLHAPPNHPTRPLGRPRHIHPSQEDT
ncbi:Mu transposase C-terminal domain-containing protein [Streptomyces nogalater]